MLQDEVVHAHIGKNVRKILQYLGCLCLFFLGEQRQSTDLESWGLSELSASAWIYLKVSGSSIDWQLSLLYPTAE